MFTDTSIPLNVSLLTALQSLYLIDMSCCVHKMSDFGPIYCPRIGGIISHRMLKCWRLNAWLFINGTLVRSHLEYGVQSYSPYRVRDLNHAENLQRLETWMVKGLYSLSYEERPGELALFYVSCRRLHCDLILVNQVIHQKVGRMQSDLFNVPLLDWCRRFSAK